MAVLFQTDPSVVVKHISNIYRSGELDEEGTCAKNAHVQKEGNRSVTRNLRYYNLVVLQYNSTTLHFINFALC